jgi:hypothetical protein
MSHWPIRPRHTNRDFRPTRRSSPGGRQTPSPPADAPDAPPRPPLPAHQPLTTSHNRPPAPPAATGPPSRPREPARPGCWRSAPLPASAHPPSTAPAPTGAGANPCAQSAGRHTLPPGPPILLDRVDNPSMNPRDSYQEREARSFMASKPGASCANSAAAPGAPDNSPRPSMSSKHARSPDERFSEPIAGPRPAERRDGLHRAQGEALSGGGGYGPTARACTAWGRVPPATSARVTDPRTVAMDERTASHTSFSGSAAPG